MPRSARWQRQALTQPAAGRSTTGYLDLLQTLDCTYPTGDLYLIAPITWPATPVVRVPSGSRRIRVSSIPPFRWEQPG